MSGGITDAPEKKFGGSVVQGATAGVLLDQLAKLPRDATVAWVDSFSNGEETIVGMGFKHGS